MYGVTAQYCECDATPRYADADRPRTVDVTGSRKQGEALVPPVGPGPQHLGGAAEARRHTRKTGRSGHPLCPRCYGDSIIEVGRAASISFKINQTVIGLSGLTFCTEKVVS